MRFAGFTCLAAVASFVASIVACSATPTNSFSGAGASGSGANGTGAGATGANGTGAGMSSGGLGGGFNGTGASGAGGAGSCSVAAELVYVLSTDNYLYSFDPGKKVFKEIGMLGCNPPSGATPNSMAVDRTATAWVNYVASDPIAGDTGGWIYKVSTVDASCAATPAVTLQPASWYRLGMGFSTDAANGTSETFYVTGTGVNGGNSPGLAKIVNDKLLTLGQFSGDAKLVGQSAELTGTGAAQLYGFFTTSPVRVAELAKNAIVLSDMPVNGVQTPMAWAFSFWGGSFYLYTSADGTTNSTVTKFDPSTKSVDATYQLTAPKVIDGAGSSTCAPLTPTM
jgi:hypothetical protein